MKVAVWDTYVTKKDGSVMHFDIIVPDNIKNKNVIYQYGKEYLRQKGQDGQPLTAQECRFCHIEVVKPEWETIIHEKGYYIYEIENCGYTASAFNLSVQNRNTDSKIVVALERVSEAFRVLLWNESKEHALSPIQTQILIFLLFHSQEKCKVSYLANEFNLTKATVSDSIKSLLSKNLIEKFEDSIDTRSYTIGLTEAGRIAANKSAAFAFAIEKPLGSLTADQKEAMLAGLLTLIHELNQAGIITIQRMCLTCANHRLINGAHHCALLETDLATHELRLDCPDYR